jgi:tetratricopeptide (TPR) repeat protein
MCAERVNFFISHAGADRAWAEWVAWELDEAGYTLELDVWDWAAGQNFVLKMNNALARCERVVALFSAAYFDPERYTTEEWTATLAHLLGMKKDLLVPVRVEEVAADVVPPLLKPLIAPRLFGLPEEETRRTLLAAVADPVRPDRKPVFPGQGRPRALSRQGASGPRLPVPGTVPRVFNVPARNPSFTGRDGVLVKIQQPLQAGVKTVVALQGMGGVGKSQLAIEYAHRFAGTYGLAWWVRAEQPGLIGQQFATLGTDLGCVSAEASTEAVRSAVLGELRDRGQWLLVFDNAEHPRDISGWLPGGDGHVLITTREHDWTQIAVSVGVDVLAARESVVILRDQVEGLTSRDARQLANELGNLPLAVAQAAAFMASTSLPAAKYLSLLKTQASRLLDQPIPEESYPRSLAAMTILIADRLAHDNPAAAQLANLCAFYASEPIPVDIFTGAAAQLPGELATRAADPVDWPATLRDLTGQSLARNVTHGILMHRLTQVILREHLPTAQAATTRVCAAAILAANNPGDASDPRTWPRWTRVMPHVLHLLSIDPVLTGQDDVRDLACGAAWYLLKRGDTRESRDLADRLYQQWKESPDDLHTMWAAGILANAFRQMGRYREARKLDEDTHARNQRLHGYDDPGTTLHSASDLAADLRALGEVETAHNLDRDTLERRRRVLGEDHPDTLGSANALAYDLRALGEVQAARGLDEDTLQRRRRVLGEDHPHTLESASNLAADQRMQGETRASSDLDRDTLERRRRVLGDDHPDTLRSASNLAADLRELGDVRAALDLDRDTLQRRRRVLGEDHPDTLESASNLAADQRMQGEMRASSDLDRNTLERRRRVLGEDHPDTLGSANVLAYDLRALGEVQAARGLDEDTLQRRRRVLGEDHPDTLESASNLAADLRMQGETRASSDLDRDTLERRRRVLGEDDLSTLASASNLAADLRELGDARAALDLDRDTLRRRRRVLGEDHPDTLESASDLAADLRMQGEVAAARDLDSDSLERRRRVLGDDHLSTLASAGNLAADLRMLGEVEAARVLDADTLERRRRVLTEDHRDTLESASDLAADLRMLGEVAAARDLDSDTLERRRRVLGDDHLSTLASAGNRAADLRMLGEVEAARDLDADTLERRRRVLDEDHRDTLESASNLAADQRMLGAVEAARGLDSDTLERRRRVLGDDHPSTLASASNLAADLRELGEVAAALDLDRDTLERRQALGENHPDTLESARNVAADLRMLGKSIDDS